MYDAKYMQPLSGTNSVTSRKNSIHQSTALEPESNEQVLDRSFSFSFSVPYVSGISHGLQLLFSDDQGLDAGEINTSEDETQQLFDQNEEEEDFEIPAFLRRQKF